MSEPERRRKRQNGDPKKPADNAYPYQPSELGKDADEAVVDEQGAVPDRAIDAPQDLIKPHLLTDSLTQAEEKALLNQPPGTEDLDGDWYQQAELPPAANDARVQDLPLNEPHQSAPDTTNDTWDTDVPTNGWQGLATELEEAETEEVSDTGFDTGFEKFFPAESRSALPPVIDWGGSAEQERIHPDDLNQDGIVSEEEKTLASRFQQATQAGEQSHVPGGEAQAPERAISASQGVFIDHSAVPIIDLMGGAKQNKMVQANLEPLNDVLSAFQGLQPGQEAFVRFGFRYYPEFRQDVERYIIMMKTGVDPGSSDGILTKISKMINYLLGSLWYHGNRGGKYIGQKPPPQSPFAKPELSRLDDLSTSEAMKQSRGEAEKKGRIGAYFETKLSIGVVGDPGDEKMLEASRREIENGFVAFAHGTQGLQFVEADGYGAASGFMPPDQENSFVLSGEELGALARVADDKVSPFGVHVHRAAVKPLPLSNPIIVEDEKSPIPGIIPFGVSAKGTEDERVVGLRVSDLDRHAFIAGRTGTGKSVLLEWLIFGTAKSGYPIVLIDPHGSLVDNVAAMLIEHCPERHDDIIILDFADEEWPVALNPLDVTSPAQVEPTIHSVMEMLSRQMALDGNSAPRAANYAQQALTVLTEANLYLKNPETKLTLLQVPSFFLDKQFRQMVLQLCSNPSVREAFDPDNGPYEQMTEKKQIEHVMPILRAFQPLGNSRSFGNVFASGKNRLNFTKLIGSNKIVLLKLSRFSHQKALAGFVGSLVIPYMLQSMDDWGRKKDPDTGEFKGRGCRLFVDEAPTVFGPSSSAIEVLAEARKWDLGLIAAAQFPKQFHPKVEEALYANTASKICLALDPQGVGGMANSLSGGTNLIQQRDLVALPNYWGYGNILLTQGKNSSLSGPFSVAFLPPMEIKRDQRHKDLIQKVYDQSHDQVCNPKDAVEGKRMNALQDIKAALAQILQERLSEAEEKSESFEDFGLDNAVDDTWEGGDDDFWTNLKL